MRYSRIIKHGFYYTTQGNNIDQTMTIYYYVVDCFGSLVCIGEYTKDWCI